MTTDSTLPTFIAITPLSKVLGVPCRSLRRWSANGTMPASIRFGGLAGQRYWQIETLREWITSLKKLPEGMSAEVLEDLKIQSAPLPKKTRPKK